MDVVVTLPLSFVFEGKKGLDGWIAEGDPAGEPWSGERWIFSVAGGRPSIEPGERVYVVHAGHLIGFSKLLYVRQLGARYWGLVRGGGAEAVTITEPIPGFRGYRYRWWQLADERPFPEWRNVGRDRRAGAPRSINHPDPAELNFASQRPPLFGHHG